MPEIICLGCGWRGNTDNVYDSSLRCGKHPLDHDNRFLWLPPNQRIAEKYTEIIRDNFSSLRELTLKLSASLPPCDMTGLSLGDIYDQIVKLVGDKEAAHHIIDILILHGHLSCLMIRKDCQEWREFRMMFSANPFR